MMTFTHVGFERECFVAKSYTGEQYINLFNFIELPLDGNPFLLEIRGEHAKTPLEAKYNLLLQHERLRRDTLLVGSTIVTDCHTAVLTCAERAELRRQQTKEPMKQYRIGGGIRLPRAGEVTAGLHVHFSNMYEFTYREFISGSTLLADRARTQYYPLNIPRIVYQLDAAFGKVITDAGRQTGLYEMKSYGFEYRSLPTTVDLDALVDVLNDIQKENA